MRTLIQLLLVAYLLHPPAGTGEVAGEYQVKAVFLFHFAQFTEWPPEAFPNPGAPIIFCTIGGNPFGDALQIVIDGEAVGGRSLTTKQIKQARDTDACNVLFFSRSGAASIPMIVAAMKQRPILTVSDADDFISQGGMIQFFNEGDHVRFRINNEAADRAGLKLSAKLLQLGK